MAGEEGKHKYQLGQKTPLGYIRQQVKSTTGELGYVLSETPDATVVSASPELVVAAAFRSAESRSVAQAEQASKRLLEEAKDDLKGFGADKGPLMFGRIKKTLLSTSISYKDTIYRRKEFVEDLVKDGYVAAKKEGRYAAVGKDKSYFLVTKAEHDYLDYFNNKSGSAGESEV